MFRVKICGITNIEDARAVADAGADAIGLNFFSKSVRNVSPDTAQEIASYLPPDVIKVGVFVNHSTDEIVQIVNHVGLDCIQLHGVEPAEIVAQLPKAIPIVRAWRSGAKDVESLGSYWGLCHVAGRVPDALLVDAPSSDDYGGTGRIADWDLIVAAQRKNKFLFYITLILAGGLTPNNVAQAIAEVRPDGVDVASGVERRPGIKDHELVKHFVSAAREAFGRL